MQFLTDAGEKLMGMVLYTSTVWSRGGPMLAQVVLIIVTILCDDEWWVSPASVVIPG